MSESTLFFQIIRDTCKFLWVMIQRKFAVFVLRKIPQTAIRNFSCRVNSIADRDSPTRRAWCDNVNIFRTLDFRRLLYLVQKISHISHCSCCSIGNIMSRHDFKHILFRTDISVYIFTCWRSCGLCAERRKTAFLDSRIHVSFIVVADIDDVIVTINNSGKRLYSDVCRTAVTCESNRCKVFDTSCTETCFNACQHRRRASECRNNGIICKTELWKIKSHCRHTACRKNGNCVLSKNFKGISHSKTSSASCASLVSIEKFVPAQIFCCHAHLLHLNSDKIHTFCTVFYCRKNILNIRLRDISSAKSAYKIVRWNLQFCTVQSRVDICKYSSLAAERNIFFQHP